MYLKIFFLLFLCAVIRISDGKAQDVSDLTVLSPDDYKNLKLPPLDTLFLNAEKNPAIRLNDAMIKDETYQLRMEKKNWLSFFSIRSGYNYGILGNYSSFSDEYTPLMTRYSGNSQHSYSIGAQVALPLNNLFNLRAQIKKQEQKVNEAEYNREIALDNVKLNIVELYANTQSSLIVLKSKAEALAYITAHYRIMENDFISGRISTETLTNNKAEQKKAIEEYEMHRAKLNTLLMQLEIVTRTKLINK